MFSLPPLPVHCKRAHLRAAPPRHGKNVRFAEVAGGIVERLAQQSSGAALGRAPSDLIVGVSMDRACAIVSSFPQSRYLRSAGFDSAKSQSQCSSPETQERRVLFRILVGKRAEDFESAPHSNPPRSLSVRWPDSTCQA
jgi:hypothetical protein